MFTWSITFLENIVYVGFIGFAVFLVGFHIHERIVDNRNKKKDSNL